MAFDISKLTSAVNKYLNSISDVSAAAKKASEEIEQKSRFKAELSDAIRQNIESRMRQPEDIPDIATTVRSQIQQAVGSIDATFEQVDGAFDDIRNAGKVPEVSESAAQDSSKEDIRKAVDLILTAAGTSSDSTGLRQVLDKIAGTSASDAGNSDAYKGLLSTEALQELSKSQYFSANLLQSSLFDENADGSSSGADSSFTTDLANALQGGSKAASPFESISLSDLNTASLTANGAAGNAGSTDLAKALIKAYANGSSKSAVTSIFGDFTL